MSRGLEVWRARMTGGGGVTELLVIACALILLAVVISFWSK